VFDHRWGEGHEKKEVRGHGNRGEGGCIGLTKCVPSLIGWGGGDSKEEGIAWVLAIFIIPGLVMEDVKRGLVILVQAS